jgi:hypothetical protein
MKVNNQDQVTSMLYGGRVGWLALLTLLSFTAVTGAREVLTSPSTVPPAGSMPVVSPGPVIPAEGPTVATTPPDVWNAGLQPPSAADAMMCFERVRAWVRAGTFTVPIDESRERTGIVAGTYVTLRVRGQIIGRGSAVGDQGDTLAEATRAALAEAARRLPSSNTALDSAAAAAMAQDISISIELSGAFIPMQPATYAQADLSVNRGVEGIAVRIGTSTSAVFPMTMLVTASAPSDAIVAAIAQASGDATLAVKHDQQAQPPDITKKNGAAFYRFHVTHIAQSHPQGPAQFLFRGSRVIGGRDISVASLRELADGLSGYLLRWQQSNPQWPYGTLLAHRGVYEQEPASIAEYAVVTYAVHRALAVKARFAQRTTNAWKFAPGEEDPSKYIGFGPHRLDEHLASTSQQNSPSTGGPMAVAARALVVMAPLERLMLGDRPFPNELRLIDPDLAQLYVLEGDAAGQSQHNSEPGWHPALPANARAFAAFVLAKRATALINEPNRERLTMRAQEAVRSVYRSTKPEQLVMHMPWLGWAEMTLAQDRSAPLPAAAALRDMRGLVEKFQMTDADAGAEGPDYVGGIVFTSSGVPFPTSHTLRPLAFIATMLGDPRLTDESERMPHLTALLSGLRFVRQLSMDDATCHVCPHLALASWGTRASTWEYRQPPEASALALLAVIETLESLDALSAPVMTPPRSLSPSDRKP